MKLKLNSRASDLVICALFCSVYLPFAATAAVLIAAFAYFCIFQNGLSVFKKRFTWPVLILAVYAAVVAAANFNWIGLASAAGYFMLVTILLYCRERCSTKTFELGLKLCCLFGTAVAILGYFDWYLSTYLVKSNEMYRCTLYFFNCNYLATVLATTVLICGYKILVFRKNVALYAAAAALMAGAIYLTGSMFVWVEVLVGLAMLLLLTRKNQLLSIVLLLAAAACIVLYCAPYLMPRLVDYSGVTTDNRLLIWRVALRDIAKNPLFGRGFLGYYHIYANYPGSYATTHCHNLLLDLLLNFGVVGTVFPIWFIVGYVKRAICCRNAQTNLQQTSLILAALAALVVHATVDLTFLWIQTGLLYCLILGGIGGEERLLGFDRADFGSAE